MAIPDGWVDPASTEQVAAVLRAVQTGSGLSALGDLIGRLPGVVRVPAVSGGLFRRETPERVWLGSENALSLGRELVHEHIVGGVVLHRQVLTAGQAPELLAGLVVRHVSDVGSIEDASAVLTAARDTAVG